MQVNFNIFVSHSTNDLGQVAQLQQQLAETPIKVFIAEHSIIPSQDLAQTINAAIENCDLFVLLWSKNARASNWVSQEIGKATALKKQILPLVLDDEVNLPGFINNLKHLHVGNDSEIKLEQIKNIIIGAYEKKLNEVTAAAAAIARSEQNTRAMLGIGAFLFLILNK